MTSWSMLYHMWCEAQGQSCKFNLSFKGDGIVDETKSWIIVQSLYAQMKFEYWIQECKHEGDNSVITTKEMELWTYVTSCD